MSAEQRLRASLENGYFANTITPAAMDDIRGVIGLLQEAREALERIAAKELGPMSPPPVSLTGGRIDDGTPRVADLPTATNPRSRALYNTVNECALIAKNALAKLSAVAASPTQEKP